MIHLLWLPIILGAFVAVICFKKLIRGENNKGVFLSTYDMFFANSLTALVCAYGLFVG
jgi:hypothetical protein